MTDGPAAVPNGAVLDLIAAMTVVATACYFGAEGWVDEAERCWRALVRGCLLRLARVAQIREVVNSRHLGRIGDTLVALAPNCR